MGATCKFKACSGGNLIVLVKKSHFEHLICKEDSVPGEGWDIQAGNVKSPGWHSKGWTKEWFCTSLETPVTGVDYSLFFVVSFVFITEYVTPVSTRKSINLFATIIFTQGSCRETVIGHFKPKGAPGPFQSSSEFSTIWEASFTYPPSSPFLFLGQSFPNAFLSGIQCSGQGGGILLCIFYLKNLRNSIYQLKGIHAKCSIQFMHFSLVIRFALSYKVYIYHPNILGGLEVSISILSRNSDKYSNFFCLDTLFTDQLK